MTFFVDANAILYSAFEGPARAGCLKLLEAVAAGRAEGRTSPAVLEEVWHVALRDGDGRLDGLAQAALEIFSPLLPVTEQAFAHALSIDHRGLGPNDRLHLGTCATNEIDVVLTADRAFDGIKGVARVDPLDPEAVEPLLGG
ncbi:MAG TPA: type II toxin-antitoxin system VapC family toxin [Solirubrobacterales bacterium]|nr:type II toxin-antitoxin system VapC family toxin [Solirubrobacterales bacterium]